MLVVKLTTGETVKFEKKLERFVVDTSCGEEGCLCIFVKDGKRFYFPLCNVLYFYSDKEVDKI